MPGKVQSFDAQNQRANIIPQIQRVLRDGDGTRGTEKLPVLPAVPVLFPSGNGFFVKFALNPGDTVLVIVCDRDVGNWITAGSSDPVDDRVHALGGAVCIPVDFKQAGPGLILCHGGESDEDEPDSETAFPISQAIPGTERIRVYQLPRVESAACLVYQGTHANMGEASRAIAAWIRLITNPGITFLTKTGFLPTLRINCLVISTVLSSVYCPR